MTNSMDGFLDNIAALVTNESGTLEQFVANLTTLTDTTKEQAATIASQQKTITTLTTKNNQLEAKLAKLGGGGTASKGDTGGYQHPGYETGNKAYCWKHGFKCKKGHTSATCKHPDFLKNPELKKATRSNPMGGCMDNKGWDE